MPKSSLGSSFQNKEHQTNPNDGKLNYNGGETCPHFHPCNPANKPTNNAETALLQQYLARHQKGEQLNLTCGSRRARYAGVQPRHGGDTRLHPMRQTQSGYCASYTFPS